MLELLLELCEDEEELDEEDELLDELLDDEKLLLDDWLLDESVLDD